MEMLKSKGMELYAAYGNTTTDIRAYAAAGIPKVTIDCLPLCMREYILSPDYGKGMS